jgi:hypothetical protein
MKKGKTPHNAGPGFAEQQRREDQRLVSQQNPMANKTNPGQRAEDHRGRIADMGPPPQRSHKE